MLWVKEHKVACRQLHKLFHEPVDRTVQGTTC